MKMRLLIILLLGVCTYGFCQKNKNKNKHKETDSGAVVKELADNACKCIDSISIDKPKEEITSAIHKCIDDQVGAYQLLDKLMNVENLKNESEKKGKKEVNITVNVNKDSDDYKTYYYKMERYLMDNCQPIKQKIATNDALNEKSISNNPEAYEFYAKGQQESKKGNTEQAIKYYEKAVKIDPNFAFAWDNLGISYRKLEQYDKAIEAYQNSLNVDPKGAMPLQNIAIAYQYKKEYKKAVEAYEKLAEITPNNSEVFYGIGVIYALNLNEQEKGLDYVCKAYNMYVEQKSPYRADAEKVIAYVYNEMKKEGKEAKFKEILKANKISIE